MGESPPPLTQALYCFLEKVDADDSTGSRLLLRTSARIPLSTSAKRSHSVELTGQACRKPVHTAQSHCWGRLAQPLSGLGISAEGPF